MLKCHTIHSSNRMKQNSLFFEKVFGTLLLMFAQISFIFIAYLQLNTTYLKLQIFLSALSILVVIHIINQPINPEYKLAWSVTILFIPIFGGMFYLLLSSNSYRRHFRNSIRQNVERSKLLLYQDDTIVENLRSHNLHVAVQTDYIYRQTQYPVYINTTVTYFSCGEKMLPSMLDTLSNAKHYIFLEYFIIQEGFFWDSILSILIKKASAGVDVRIIYDDFGCVNTLPKHYPELLKQYGIRCARFNPLRPVLSLRLNNRDHRKLLIIDGYYSYTGGINLSDEYINRAKQNGYWKDSGILLQGDATWSFTTMFLQMWQHLSGQTDAYENYLPQIAASTGKNLTAPNHNFEAKLPYIQNGFIQPYADNPLYAEEVAEKVYLNLIQHATRYIYITTPYLVLGHEMITALSLAAQSGIDVRIITPGIPDKKTVFMMSRSFYEPLLKAGVKIYEYTPGFLHAKMMVADDIYGVIGTINLDYRSLYLHFECATFLCYCSAITDIKNDILDIISVAEEITYSYCKNMNRPYRIWQSLLRLYAPLV